jgi:hypothetical protein
MQPWQPADTSSARAIFAQIECNLEAMLLEYNDRADSLPWERRRSAFWNLTVQVGQVLAFGAEHNLEPERLPGLEVLHFDMIRAYNQRFAN